MTTPNGAAHRSDSTVSKLEARLNELIARDEGVQPEDVTVEFIHNRREAKIYPNERFDTSSRYGGR